MDLKKSVFDEKKYDDFCIQKEDLIDTGFSQNDVYGVLVGTKLKGARDSCVIRNKRAMLKGLEPKHVTYIEMCDASGVTIHEKPLRTSIISDVNDLYEEAQERTTLFQRALGVLNLRHEESGNVATRLEKGDRKASSFLVSRAAAELSSKYILNKKSIYSQEVFSGGVVDSFEKDFTIFDKTSLVEDLRRYIGETFLKSVVLIARRESRNGNDSQLITQRVGVNEYHLLSEIGDRVLSKYRPIYSDINKFNNLLCIDIINFVRNADFSGGWGELVYDNQENAVYLRMAKSKNAVSLDSPLTTRVGVEGLE